LSLRRVKKGRRRRVEGKGDEEGVDFIASSSTAMGRGLGVFRREKRVKLRPKTV
jgi:hypothetical protein